MFKWDKSLNSVALLVFVVISTLGASAIWVATVTGVPAIVYIYASVFVVALALDKFQKKE